MSNSEGESNGNEGVHVNRSKPYRKDRFFCSVVQKEAERLILTRPIPILTYMRNLTPTHCIKILRFLSTQEDVLDYCVLLACLTDFISCECFNIGLINKPSAWAPGPNWFLWQLSEAWISIIHKALTVLSYTSVLSLVRSFQLSFRLLEYHKLHSFFLPLNRLFSTLEYELSNIESRLLIRLKDETSLRALLNVLNSNFIDSDKKIIDDWLNSPPVFSWLTNSLQYPFDAITNSKISKSAKSLFYKPQKRSSKRLINSFLSLSSDNVSMENTLSPVKLEKDKRIKLIGIHKNSSPDLDCFIVENELHKEKLLCQPISKGTRDLTKYLIMKSPTKKETKDESPLTGIQTSTLNVIPASPLKDIQTSPLKCIQISPLKAIPSSPLTCIQTSPLNQASPLKGIQIGLKYSENLRSLLNIEPLHNLLPLKPLEPITNQPEPVQHSLMSNGKVDAFKLLMASKGRSQKGKFKSKK